LFAISGRGNRAQNLYWCGWLSLMPEIKDTDYIFGTHEEELERLGLQHRVWQPRVHDAWKRAGFGKGQTIIDVGSGPGFATLDLAELVGPEGRVIALERSERFIAALNDAAEARGLRNIETYRVDLDKDPLPDIKADGVWARWVFAFLQKPDQLVQSLSNLLKPGGAVVIHEYFHYSTWQLIPNSEWHHTFVEKVMESWRKEGGEPNIAKHLIGWIERANKIESLTPLVHAISPNDFMWQWPKSFIDIGTRRLAATGHIDTALAERIRQDFLEMEAQPGVRMVTPAVMEIIARKK
jgi:ubiquinone/menaquinone biosynthesis C-methylase UbiE